MEYAKLLDQWQPQTITDLDRMLLAKRQIHQAVQLVSMVSRNILPHHPWDIFGNLEWRSDLGMFLGWAIPGRFDIRAGLRAADLKLFLLTPQGRPFAEFSLEGRKYADGFQWLQTTITEFGIDASAMKMDLPYDIPAYPQADGEAFFVTDVEAFADFSRSFSNAQLILDHVAELHAIWQQVKCWPHHFDISSRRRFEKGEQVWHMGVGYSPGDDHNYPEPYWHLTCYPSDDVDKDNLPALPGDLQWRTDDWLGVVLKWSDIVKEASAEGQLKQVLSMIDGGMAGLEEVKR